MKKIYYLAWVEEEENWYYSTKGFDLKEFPYGYVDYEVEVEDGTIIADSYSRDRVGKKFEDYYDESLWVNN